MSNLRDMRVYCKLNTGKVPNLSTSLSGKYLDLILSFSGTQTNVGSFLHIRSKSSALKENMIYSISRSCQKNIQRRTETLFIASISHLAMCTCSVWEKKKIWETTTQVLNNSQGLRSVASSVLLISLESCLCTAETAGRCYRIHMGLSKKDKRWRDWGRGRAAGRVMEEDWEPKEVDMVLWNWI